MNPLLLKGIVGVVLVAAIFFSGYKVGGNLEELSWLREKAKIEKQQAEDALKAQGVSSAYQLRLLDLENQARNRPARVVRVCNDPVQIPGSSGGSDGEAQSGVQPTPGPDIGSKLYQLTDDCDKGAAQLSALQEWVNTVAKTQD